MKYLKHFKWVWFLLGLVVGALSPMNGNYFFILPLVGFLILYKLYTAWQSIDGEHDWGQWETMSEGTLHRSGSKVGEYINMRRVCKNTGEIQLKDVRTC